MTDPASYALLIFWATFNGLAIKEVPNLTLNACIEAQVNIQTHWTPLQRAVGVEGVATYTSPPRLMCINRNGTMGQ